MENKTVNQYIWFTEIQKKKKGNTEEKKVQTPRTATRLTNTRERFSDFGHDVTNGWTLRLSCVIGLCYCSARSCFQMLLKYRKALFCLIGIIVLSGSYVNGLRLPDSQLTKNTHIVPSSKLKFAKGPYEIFFDIDGTVSFNSLYSTNSVWKCTWLRCLNIVSITM